MFPALGCVSPISSLVCFNSGQRGAFGIGADSLEKSGCRSKSPIIVHFSEKADHFAFPIAPSARCLYLAIRDEFAISSFAVDSNQVTKPN